MKRIIVLAIIVFGISTSAFSQSYIFVDSEKVFKSMTDYNTAITELEKMTEDAQKKIDDTYKEIDDLFNRYQEQKASLSQSDRNRIEEHIIATEKSIKEYQEGAFGQEGSLMKSRMERIKPIQERVFAAINKYATTNKCGAVIDLVNNQTILYYLPALDKTEEIIKLLK